MDPVINSQLQSPLARNLQHISSDLTTFTYHVEQNAPPLSIHKTIVNPQSSRAGFDTTYNFRIPQYGYLAKLALKLTYKIKPYQRTHVTPVLPLYHMIDRIDLMSHNNVIETHFGDTIMIKHAYYSSAETAATKLMGQLNVPVECDSYVDIAELFKNTSTGAPFNPFDPTQWNNESNVRYVTLFCEIPLSFTDNPAMYLDTRFVEFLDVQVKLQSTKHSQPLFMAAAAVELDMGGENIQLDPRKHTNTARMGVGYHDKVKQGQAQAVTKSTTLTGDPTPYGWHWAKPVSAAGEILSTGGTNELPTQVGAVKSDYDVANSWDDSEWNATTAGFKTAAADLWSVQNNTTNEHTGMVTGCKCFYYRPFATRVAANDPHSAHTYMDAAGDMFVTGQEKKKFLDLSTAAAATDWANGARGADFFAANGSQMPPVAEATTSDQKLFKVDAAGTGKLNTTDLVEGRADRNGYPQAGSAFGGMGYVVHTHDGAVLANVAASASESGVRHQLQLDNSVQSIFGNGGSATQNWPDGQGANIYELQLGARPYSRVSSFAPLHMGGFYPTVDVDGFSAAAHAGEPRFIRVGACDFKTNHYTVGFWGVQFDRGTETATTYGGGLTTDPRKVKDNTTYPFGVNINGLSSTSVKTIPENLSNLANPGADVAHVGMVLPDDSTTSSLGNFNNDNGTLRAHCLRAANAIYGFDKVTCSSIAALWANFGGRYVYNKVTVHGSNPMYNVTASSNEAGACDFARTKAVTVNGFTTYPQIDDPFMESRFSPGASLGSGVLYDPDSAHAPSRYRVEISTANCVCERFYAMFPYLNTAVAGPGKTTAMWPASMSSSKSSSGHGSISNAIRIEGSSNNADVYGTPDAADVACQMLVTYLHLHDKVREEVSMDNYKDNMPATILYHDSYAEYQGVGYGDEDSNYAKNTDTAMIVPLRSKHFAYAISIVAYRKKTDQQLVAGHVYNAAHDGSTPAASLQDISMTGSSSRGLQSRPQQSSHGFFDGNALYKRLYYGGDFAASNLDPTSDGFKYHYALGNAALKDPVLIAAFNGARAATANLIPESVSDAGLALAVQQGPAATSPDSTSIYSYRGMMNTAPKYNYKQEVKADGQLSASSIWSGNGTECQHPICSVGRGTAPFQGWFTLNAQAGETVEFSQNHGPVIPSDPTATWPNYKVVENFKTVKPTYVKLSIAGRNIYETAQQTAQATSYYSVAGGSYIGGRGSGQWAAEKDMDNLPFHYNEGNNRGEGGSVLRIPQLIEDKNYAGSLHDHIDATVITFGLNKTDELSNNGGLGLSSATNAQLELKFAEPCRVSVYVHHHATLQIDSNTGVMSRSLDV